MYTLAETLKVSTLKNIFKEKPIIVKIIVYLLNNCIKNLKNNYSIVEKCLSIRKLFYVEKSLNLKVNTV